MAIKLHLIINNSLLICVNPCPIRGKNEFSVPSVFSVAELPRYFFGAATGCVVGFVVACVAAGGVTILNKIGLE